MTIRLIDRANVSSVKRTSDGYLAAEAKVARTGVQIYHGSEVGRPDMTEVRVYRSPEEVFHKDSIRTYAHRPITDDHPHVPVTDKNWKKLARGHTGEEIVRDGEFVKVPMLLMDEGIIREWENGKKQLSLGYTCDIKFEPGSYTDDKGVEHVYDAVQTNIRANHLALVKIARGGDTLRLGDSGDFIKIGPDQYKRKGGKGKIYTLAQVQAYYSKGNGWDSAPTEDAETTDTLTCAECGREVPEGTTKCPHCGYEFDDELREGLDSAYVGDNELSGGGNPYHVPAGSPRGGQFATAAEAGATLQGIREKFKKAKVIRREEIVGDPNWLKRLLGRSSKKITYHISTPDSADAITADAPTSDGIVYGGPLMRIVVDGVNLELNDKDAQIIKRTLDAFGEMENDFEELKRKRLEELKKKEEEEAAYKTDSAKLTTQLATKDAEIAELKKQIGDAALTPSQLDQMVKDRMDVIGKAKALIGDKLIVDGKTEGDMRRQVVNAFVGDAAKAWDDGQIATSFATITIKAPASSPVRDMARVFDSAPVPSSLVEDSYKKYDEYLRGASANKTAA